MSERTRIFVPRSNRSVFGKPLIGAKLEPKIEIKSWLNRYVGFGNMPDSIVRLTPADWEIEFGSIDDYLPGMAFTFLEAKHAVLFKLKFCGEQPDNLDE